MTGLTDIRDRTLVMLRALATRRLSPADSMRVAKALVRSAELMHVGIAGQIEADGAASAYVNDLYNVKAEEIVTPRDLAEQAPAVVAEPMRVG